MNAKQAGRTAEVGVGILLPVNAHELAIACEGFCCFATAMSQMLPDALAVVAIGDLQGFVPFYDPSHLIESIVNDILLRRWENVGGGSGGGELVCYMNTHITNVKEFVRRSKIW